MEEIWKDIPGYEGLYQVSSLGRVKSLERYITYCTGRIQLLPEKILKSSQQSTGYYTVGLYDSNHKSKTFSIHRIVANLFVPNLSDLPEVNHKDGDKSNNSASNLEWASELDNIRHSRLLGLNRTEMNPQCKAVICVETEQQFYSVEEAARHFNVNSSLVLDRIINPNRKNRVLPNIHFQYAEDFQ